MEHQTEKEEIKTPQFLPKLIAWEVTRSCMLNCLHCRAAAKHGRYPNELTTEECFRFLDDVKFLFQGVPTPPIIILTGGEPMLRKDIFEIAAYGAKKGGAHLPGLTPLDSKHLTGLTMVMAPCGVLVNEETAKKILDSGIKRISLSLDGATAGTHDRFRGVKGSYAAVLKAMDSAKKVGLEFQVNTTVTKHNLKELPQILQLAKDKGAVGFHPFLLVPTGRGKELADWELTPEEYEKTLTWIYEESKKMETGEPRPCVQERGEGSSTESSSTFQFKPTCAPHYYRIVRQHKKMITQIKDQITQISPSNHLHSFTKGCMGGQYFAFVSHTGKVQICGFLEVECGDIRKEPFSKIWYNSKIFQEMRNWDNYHGRCGICEYRKICGGCRARAYALTGDYLAEEPYCIYQPKRQKSL